MNAPPGGARTQSGITGTRPNAETKRGLSARIIKAMVAADMQPLGWQVRSLVATLIANQEVPTEADLMRALMAAPWFPKPQRRHWRIGEGGGWGVRS